MSWWNATLQGCLLIQLLKELYPSQFQHPIYRHRLECHPCIHSFFEQILPLVQFVTATLVNCISQMYFWLFDASVQRIGLTVSSPFAVILWDYCDSVHCEIILTLCSLHSALWVCDTVTDQSIQLWSSDTLCTTAAACCNTLTLWHCTKIFWHGDTAHCNT